MFLKLSLLLLGLSVGIATAFRVQLSLKTNQKVQELRGDTLVLAEQHQDLSKACFDYYNPRLNTIFATYENSYTHCINVYETNKDLVIEAYRDVRIQLENSYRDSCVTLSCCNQTANAFGAFTCTSTVVSSLLVVPHFIYILLHGLSSMQAFNDAKIFYEVSANATDAAEKSKADFNRVDTNKSVCVNEAERNYVESTTLCYTELNECLVGKSAIPASSLAPQTTEYLSTDSTPLSTDDPAY